jgi:hypothetical protein
MRKHRSAAERLALKKRQERTQQLLGYLRQKGKTQQAERIHSRCVSRSSATTGGARA